MWRRRTPEDIEFIRREKVRSHSRVNPTKPLLISFAVSTGTVLMMWAGWRGKFTPWGEPIQFVNAVARFPALFLVTFALFYIVRIFGLLPNERKPVMVICNQCQRVQEDEGKTSCACGGLFEPLEHWRWRDD